ncbi:MAG TPA: collagen-like protein [Chryseosolibacter sp.]|nr:collagen-like protein [Chryseosolibacter sp.]
MFLPFITAAQTRFAKLVIEPNQTYHIKSSDILVADTLIMMDSSTIILNSTKKENFIRAKVAMFGNNTIIKGRGINGLEGKNGSKVRSPLGPCKDGYRALDGARGTNGASGVKLYLYLDNMIVNGSLIIDLAGGNGGDGGDGGPGGDGSPGTRHCNGGDGARGGKGGPGGNGGNGGEVIFVSREKEKIRQMIGYQIAVNILGGNSGYGGLSGYGGSAGLGPSGKNGKAGAQGEDGARGQPGHNGRIQFE